jgi:hypothetical protein
VFLLLVFDWSTLITVVLHRYLEAPVAAEGAAAAGGGGAVDERRMKAAEKAAADASKQLEAVKGRLKEAEERVKVLEKEAKTAAKAATASGGGGEFSAKDKIMLEKKVKLFVPLAFWRSRGTCRYVMRCCRLQTRRRSLPRKSNC